MVATRVDGLRVEYPSDAAPNIRVAGLYETAQAEIAARGLEPEMAAVLEIQEAGQTDGIQAPAQIQGHHENNVCDAAL